MNLHPKRIRQLIRKVPGGPAITITLVGIGMGLWSLGFVLQPDNGERANSINSLGISLLTGAIISSAFVWLDGKQSARREREALVFQLSMTPDLSGIDLRDQDLRGIYFGGKVMRNANLAGAQLSGASFYQTDLTGSDLSRADLTNADLAAATLTRATMIGTNLNSADLTDARLDDAIIVGTSMDGVKGIATGTAND